MTTSKHLSLIFFTTLIVTTINAHSLWAMDEAPKEEFTDGLEQHYQNIKDLFDADKSDVSVVFDPDIFDSMRLETIQNPEKLCAEICKILQENNGSVEFVILTFRKLFHEMGKPLTEMRDESGRTALHHTCMFFGKYSKAAIILMGCIPITQLLDLITAKDNAEATILHTAAANAVITTLELFLKAADRCVQKFPDKKAQIFEWITARSIFGGTALDHAKQSAFVCAIDKELLDARIACIDLLEKAEEKYRPENQ